MDLLTPKRRDLSPATTRHNTSMGKQVETPGRKLKILGLSTCSKQQRFKRLEYGTTWKQFVLPEFRGKDLAQSLSTICTPRKKQMQSGLSDDKSPQLARFQTFGITHRSLNEMMDSQSVEDQEPLGTMYLRQETEYLRGEMQRILIQKYKPGAKTLY